MPADPASSAPGRHGRLLALIKRKPLEAVGAAAGVAAIGFALWKRHQAGQDSQAAPGATASYLAPADTGGGPAGTASGPGSYPDYSAQLEAIQDQLEQLDRARHPRPHHRPGPRRIGPPERTHPPRRHGRRGERMHPGAPR